MLKKQKKNMARIGSMSPSSPFLIAVAILIGICVACSNSPVEEDEQYKEGGRKWSWGNVFDIDIRGITVHANIASDYLLPVGSFPTGISPYGVYNMAGNVQEWVADWYAADYYARSPRNNPKGPENGIARVLRGGSWRHQKSHHVLSANRNYQSPDYSSNFVGFRCAWSKSMIGQHLIDTKR